MGKILKFGFGGTHYGAIRRALKDGYAITGESSFPSRKVVLKKEVLKTDKLCIRDYEEAVYWMGGGFPRPTMVNVETLTLKVQRDALYELSEKVDLGWKVSTYNSKTLSYTLVKEYSTDNFANTIEELKKALI